MDKEDGGKVIYRCGWCGMPTDKDGIPLEGLQSAQECDKYLEDNAGAKVVLISGDWCL